MMNELSLKYGCNPNQKPARIFMKKGSLPMEILNGNPGYINLLDALNGWQLVKELKEATGLASAASFKHVSPAGAAVAVPLNETMKKMYFVNMDNVSDIAAAYIRARGADRMSSYGDFVALSEECDVSTARYLSTEVSDGIIAPSYSEEALAILMKKRRGNYLIIQMDPQYIPDEIETKDVFGITFEQGRNNVKITKEVLCNIPTENKEIPEDAKRDLMISLIILKYTQSNSVCYVKDGQAIGIGAGQQSRIHCTRLAGNKADTWFMRQHPKVLSLPFLPELKRVDRDNAIDVYISEEYMDLLADGLWETIFTEKPEPITKQDKMVWLKKLSQVSLGSDAFFPFGDNIERAYKSGVSYIAQSGGSIRDDNVIEVCNKYGLAMALTGIRLFHH
jgi:AICAR transformylase/IMP cyclohydrolase PurH